jgi:hypothetical protein
MNLEDWKSIRATNFYHLETLRRLQDRFSDYVTLLHNLENGNGSLEEVRDAQHELLLRLHNEDSRFLEWHDGEQLLNNDVFDLAENPTDHIGNGLLAPTARRALAKLQHLVEQAQAEMDLTDRQIAALMPRDLRAPSEQAVYGAGQQYDAFRQVQKSLGTAKKLIQIIDGYVDETVLDLLKDKPSGVEVHILTKARGLRPALVGAMRKFNDQYGGLQIRTSDAFHDRFIIVDDVHYYHLGASIKDAGKAGFMYSRLESEPLKDTVRKLFESAWSAADVI